MRQLCNVTVLLLLFGLTSCQNNGDKQTTMSPVKVKVLRVSSSEIDGTERFSGSCAQYIPRENMKSVTAFCTDRL